LAIVFLWEVSFLPFSWFSLQFLARKHPRNEELVEVRRLFWHELELAELI